MANETNSFEFEQFFPRLGSDFSKCWPLVVASALAVGEEPVIQFKIPAAAVAGQINFSLK